MNLVALRYHLPSRQHFSDTVIGNLVERAEVNAFLGFPLQPLHVCPYPLWVSNKKDAPNCFKHRTQVSCMAHQVQAYIWSARSVRLETFLLKNAAD